MSLEAKVAELTAAVNNLTSAFLAASATVNTGAPHKVSEADAVKALTDLVTEDDAPAEKAPAKKKAAPKKEAPVKEAPKEEPKKATQDDLREALTALAKSKGRGGVIDLLATFDATSVGELKESQYAEVVEAANKQA